MGLRCPKCNLQKGKLESVGVKYRYQCSGCGAITIAYADHTKAEADFKQGRVTEGYASRSK